MDIEKINRKGSVMGFVCTCMDICFFSGLVPHCEKTPKNIVGSDQEQTIYLTL